MQHLQIRPWYANELLVRVQICCVRRGCVCPRRRSGVSSCGSKSEAPDVSLSLIFIRLVWLISRSRERVLNLRDATIDRVSILLVWIYVHVAKNESILGYRCWEAMPALDGYQRQFLGMLRVKRDRILVSFLQILGRSKVRINYWILLLKVLAVLAYDTS